MEGHRAPAYSTSTSPLPRTLVEGGDSLAVLYAPSTTLQQTQAERQAERDRDRDRDREIVKEVGGGRENMQEGGQAAARTGTEPP